MKPLLTTSYKRSDILSILLWKDLLRRIVVVAVLDDDLMLPCMERFIVGNGGYGGGNDDKNGMERG